MRRLLGVNAYPGRTNWSCSGRGGTNSSRMTLLIIPGLLLILARSDLLKIPTDGGTQDDYHSGLSANTRRSSPLLRNEMPRTGIQSVSAVRQRFRAGDFDKFPLLAEQFVLAQEGFE